MDRFSDRVDDAGVDLARTVGVGRRVVLGMLVAGGVGTVLGGPISRGLGSVLAPLQNRDPTGLSALIPGGGGWRYYSVTATQPSISTADATLSVNGLVDRPSTYRFADLQQLPTTTLVRDFQCVTGWRVPNVRWSGVGLRDLLDDVGVQAQGRALRFESADGAYTESLTLDQARTDEVLVATHMDGDVVTQAHGGPIRLYVAPMYGYKSLKWLSRIEVVDAVEPGYWERRGYDVDAYVGASNGRSDPAIS